jgi:hypothetical protein
VTRTEQPIAELADFRGIDRWTAKMVLTCNPWRRDLRRSASLRALDPGSGQNG